MYSAKISASGETQESLIACLALEGFFGFVVDVPFQELNLSIGTFSEDLGQPRTITFFSNRWYSSHDLSLLEGKLRDLLVLDEATSSLDTESERLIQKSIENLSGKMTVVVIAHRLSTIRNADYIYVLDKGKVIEEGNYKTLSKKSDSRLKQMVEHQAL